MRLAPVRPTFHHRYLFGDFFIDLSPIEDVTTRGSYYPDKSMATPTVSLLSCDVIRGLLIRLIEPPALSSCYEHHQGGAG